MLLIHRSERADALVAALGALLQAPADDPFRPEIVGVPSRGVERWLAQQLSHVLGAGEGDDGVCANVLFPSYTRFLDEVIAEADDAYAASVEAWAPRRSTWPLLAVIDRCAPTEPWCRLLAAHLGLDGTGSGPGNGRRFAVAGKLAGLFDRYAHARPEMIKAWQDGRDEHGDGTPLPDDLRWQAELWRQLRQEIAVPSPAELLDRACRRLGTGAPFSIFGATRISPARVRILHALAAQRDVHLWLHHPSPALWQAVRAEQPARRRDRAPLAANPLLASMSRDVRELQQLLQTGQLTDQHHPIGPRPATLLGRLQDELAHDRVPGTRVPIEPDDDSLRVHAAHGSARQVEIVREAILGLLEADPTLEPRDIVIMCPDVETFAPLVAASFGQADDAGAHPAGRLRVKLADRSLRQTNPLLRLLSALLELAASRVTATQLLDVIGAAPVRRQFGLDDDDVERIRDWTVTAGARWGLDAEHRGAYHLSSIRQGTWRDAIDRVLAGVAMEDDVAWVGDTVPLDDVDSGDIDLAGRFAEIVDRVDHAVRSCNETHSARDWAGLLDEIVGGLGEGDQPWQAMQLHRELDDIADSAADLDVDLGLADIVELLRDRLAGRPTRASFRTGTLTVCTLVPMRSVPHRVVCLLGMDDGAFPRQGIADGDDVLARDPRTGERDVRSEDRQLFLDAVCAAQEHLVIAYTGADPRTGAVVPPCVPLGELLDAVDATAVGSDERPAREHVVVHHPLQPFDPRNFVAGELGTAGPFSFDRSALAGARAAEQQRRPVRALVTEPLPRAERTDTVDLDELIRFFQHPVRGFVRQRLAISTATSDDDPNDALPVELDGLEDWAVGDRALQQCVAGIPQETVVRLERLRGELPPGPLGTKALRRIGDRIKALLLACDAERRLEPGSIDVAVPLPDGRILAGTIADVRGSTLLTVTYSRLGAKHRVTAWLRYLALTAAGAGEYRAVTVGRWQNDARRSILAGITPDLARRVLAILVGIRDAGLREPLPLALETSASYAERRHRGASVGDSLPEVRKRWEADRFRPERDDPEHVMVFGPKAPFTRLTDQQPVDGEEYPNESTRFGVLSRLVWDPLLTVETDERP